MESSSGQKGKKVGKISATVLNQKDIDKLFEAVGGGYLIIEQAGEQLVMTENSVTEIALNCGFHDMSYFSKTFTRLGSLISLPNTLPTKSGCSGSHKILPVFSIRTK